ncbi:hypothetical protein PsalN5692_03162 [Piscirickettsia salmonis]|uniref:hypothetical protein n=1 Tax=Piscirickettsia salmonis TaxID=1238 RepID=UPI0012B8E3BC|nr:hypothetical protein [Piscirickettsia salmonis]QGP51675.1 hypothetical protein PsalN5692_03162 [Piscirickettsia salmonis]QGP53110.1 hypothetical protein PsalSR1_00515 [Piscirickettsia salmonis]QGP60953.1 hypothetical protein PsalBI1_03576 [Piscirickettsia salmonis]QGP62679.1 hypothetical protein PsalMR5_00516 [Piscirickettsia salmonis]
MKETGFGISSTFLIISTMILAVCFSLIFSNVFASPNVKERNWSDIWRELENISYQQYDIFEHDTSDSDAFWQGIEYMNKDSGIVVDLRLSGAKVTH